MSKIDPIILGHNQFIGVSHLSQDAARSRVERFSDIKKVMGLIKDCLDLNVRGVMLSTHPAATNILEYAKTKGLSKELNFYPLIPYAQGYVRKMNEKGVMGLINDVLKPAGLSKTINIFLTGGIGFLKKDYNKLLGTLIDLELLPFENFNVKAVFLHNIVTDLALALEAEAQLKFYINHIRENYNAIPAFATMNFARFVKTFDKWGIKQPLIMSSFNKVGFQMNPARQECEQCLKEYNVNVLAMSTLAAGYLKPKEAYRYLSSLPNIKSVVVGVSTKEHAKETFKLIRNNLHKN